MGNILVNIYRKIVPSFIRRIIYFIRNSIYLFIKSVFNIFKYNFIIFLYYFFRIFPVQKNKIFIQNFFGNGYSDSPRYICEELFSLNTKYKIYWALRYDLLNNFPKNTPVKIVLYGSIKSIFHDATSKIWIDTCRKNTFVRKRKSQYYIHLWHGIPLKRIEKDVEQNLSISYVKMARHDSTLINLIISESRFQTQIYRSSFWYNGEILECCSPRHSFLINADQNIKDIVNDKLKINKNTKVILYAPTFRSDYNTDAYNIDYEYFLGEINKHTNSDWIILIRLHPNISNKSNFINYNERVISVSNYDDVQELYLVSDILITDYSGCMFDFSVLNKPVFLYINDYEKYKNDRDFYFEISSLPYPSAENTNDLIDKIIKFNEDEYLKSLSDFFNKIGIIKDKNGTKKIVDKIISQTNIK